GLTGVVRVWPVAVGDKGRAAFLGPIAVAERRRGNGVAFKLMERAIGVCREQGYAAVILVGDHDYYERFGFKQAGAGRFQLPGPVDQHRILIRDLSDRAAKLKGALAVPRGT
ncbi:MAG TPA: N-acetyltransferase, partial [Hyphomonadaceae bacterium]|nr:N-acetyltransferase [Hyphomonadaceae bacterium]